MVTNDKLILAKVIQRVKYIAEHEFDGKIYDNVLLIFSQLSHKERATLLRGLINICYIVEDNILVNSAEGKHDHVELQSALTNATIAPANVVTSTAPQIIVPEGAKEEVKKPIVTVENEISDMNEINQLELIKLKSWLFKTITIAMFIAAIGFIWFMSYTSRGSSPIGDTIDMLFKLVKIMTGV